MIVITSIIDDAWQLIAKLAISLILVRLHISFQKAKFITNLVTSNNTELAVYIYGKLSAEIYLGHEINIDRNNQICKIHRRIGLS